MFGVSFFGVPGKFELVSYTEAGTFKFMPRKGATGYYAEVIGGGGGGRYGGGGGGGFNCGFVPASEVVDEVELVVGAGGAGAASPTAQAGNGSDSYFGTFVRARGGQGGYNNSTIALSGDYTGDAVSPNNSAYASAWTSGSGGGGTSDADGGSCIKGGAGGGKPNNAGSASGSGGVSLEGGNGGDGSHTGDGQDGSAPGGGGGGSHAGTGGDGAQGQVKVWIFY